MKKMILNFTTSGAGAASASGERAVLGKLYAVEYNPAATSNATIVLTCLEAGAVSKPLLTKTGAGAADVWFYPRDIPHGVEDGAVLTAAAGGDRVMPLMAGIPTLAVTSGGATLTGRIVLYFEV